MTYHSTGEKLVCHHCNRLIPVPRACPECGSARIKFFGVGTQRVETAVREMLPKARVVRWDRDTTGQKGAHEEFLRGFMEHEADILIGTQMIAKGLDLPLVTLVGVVSADTALNLPDFRAGERSFQLLAQVAGRAGRSILGGRVIIQTYAPDHYAVQAAQQHDYEAFYAQEIAFRREQHYPPVSRLVRLINVNSSARRCEDEALKMAEVLLNKIGRLGIPDVTLTGPAPCFFRRVRGKYRWHIIVRGAQPASVLSDLSLPLGWRVDVDPISTL
jgi:primosomal protein N' (replication factor Y)